MRPRTFSLALCTAALLTACGQRGDLYLPGQTREAVNAPAPTGTGTAATTDAAAEAEAEARRRQEAAGATGAN